MEDPTEAYFQALRQINAALTKGLATAIAVIENPEGLNEQQLKFITEKLKELVEASKKAYGTEATIH